MPLDRIGMHFGHIENIEFSHANDLDSLRYYLLDIYYIILNSSNNYVLY